MSGRPVARLWPLRNIPLRIPLTMDDLERIVSASAVESRRAAEPVAFEPLVARNQGAPCASLVSCFDLRRSP